MSRTTRAGHHIHHVIPRHMGGTDEPSNLLELTIGEHAVAHRKLYEKFGHHQDLIAWLALEKVISKDQARRLAVSGALSGKSKSEEQRMKISKSLVGRKLSAETIAKMSASRRGKKKPPRTPEHCANLSASRRAGAKYRVANGETNE